MSDPSEVEPGTELGRGRSAIVYRLRDSSGRDIASKVFVGDPAGKLVNYILTGAPNAYSWNDDAVRCAMLRRQIVAELVEFWFGDTVGVADAYAVHWNESTRTHAMDTRFVQGRAASLHHPFSSAREGEYRDQQNRVMRPLQRLLAEAGLDGLVWQAGRGNPVAVNNFLLTGEDEDRRWVWIDLESGVPALAPLNPLDLFGFYLPKSWHHRRPLFDDVDTDRLRAYVKDNEGQILTAIGEERTCVMKDRIQELDEYQYRWRSMPRALRSITYQKGKQKLTAEQANWYARHPVRWYAREFRRGSLAGLGRLGGLAAAAVRWIVGIDYLDFARRIARFVTSQRYRSILAHAYVASRIDAWHERGQINADNALLLHNALHREGVHSYITDFGVHISIKPLIKFVQWVVLPPLLLAGWIGPATASVLFVFGGMIGRTAYTSIRMVQSALAGYRIPWVALLVGLPPVLGNIAYPVQLLVQSAGTNEKLAAFMLYDIITFVGEKVPIWGGRDTATEHTINRLADLIVRRRT